MGRYWLAEQEMKRNCLVSIEKKKKKMKVNLGELERKHKCSYGYETIAIPVDGKILASIIAELSAARECCEYLERILDTDAVRNENEELDGEASAVLAEWKKSTNGDG